MGKISSKEVQGVLITRVFSLQVFGYTRLRKIINSKKKKKKKSVCNAFTDILEAVFGRAKAGISRFKTRKSVIHNFWACSIYAIHGLHSMFRNVL